MHAYVYFCVYIFLWIHTHIRKYEYGCKCIQGCIQVRTFVCVCVYILVCIFVCMHVCVYTRMHVCLGVWCMSLRMWCMSLRCVMHVSAYVNGFVCLVWVCVCVCMYAYKCWMYKRHDRVDVQESLQSDTTWRRSLSFNRYRKFIFLTRVYL